MSLPINTNPDHEAVYDAVRALPTGTVITYGDLAERVGRPASHARVVANILGRRPQNDATNAAEHDIPWWRVVRADGGLLGPDHEMDDHRKRWVAWAKAQLAEEGVAFTNDGRVASIAGRSKPSGGGGGRKSRLKVDTSLPVCHRCYDRHAGFTCPS